MEGENFNQEIVLPNTYFKKFMERELRSSLPT